MSRPILFYYESEGKIYYLDNDTGLLGCDTKQNLKFGKAECKYNVFHLFKDYDHDLVRFRDEFIRCADELKALERDDIDYYKYYHHNSAVELTWNRWSNSTSKIEAVAFEEFLFMEKCNNGGLIHLTPKYANTSTECYGYDFTAFYPNMLIHEDLKIPTLQGIPTKLAEIDYSNLKYGIYHVVISCNNTDFKKVFSFSKDNYYTHYSLQFAYQYKESFDIKFELVQDDKPNALIYDCVMLSSMVVFYNWYSRLFDNKKHFVKKNMLFKRLTSTLWGSIVRCQHQILNDEQMADLDFDELRDVLAGDETDAELVIIDKKFSHTNGIIKTLYFTINKSNPYKYNMARLKPFMLSFARNYVGRLILDNGLIDNVIRIQTDGIVLNKPFDFKGDYIPIIEDKTTGTIFWNNVNKYNKIDDKKDIEE
jgi:hypothetical protein